MQTFKQFVTTTRKNMARECEVTIKEVTGCYPDHYFRQDYAQYVEELAKDKETRFTAQFLNQYYNTFGGNALRVLLKFYPHVRPEYYVHPDCREV
jgi:hypothetical protein